MDEDENSLDMEWTRMRIYCIKGRLDGDENMV
jgi:hypothetical protein